MKNTIFALLLGTLLFSCRKEETTTNNTQDYVQAVSAALHDSLSTGDYASLDFSRASESDIDSINIRLLRIPLVAKSIATDFFVARTDVGGHVFSGRFVKISKDTSQLNAFTGTVAVRSMKGVQKAVRLREGHIVKAPGSASSLMADEPEMDGGDLPPVVVTASYGSGGISYADWYNLLEMAGDEGYGYTGYYSPSSGGGGGGNGSAPTMQVDFEAPESKDAIDVAKYIKCFGATQEAGATYTVTIAVDIPVDDDPTKIFNWADASPGHTFIELYKNSSAGLVQQVVGFYPNQPWKTVAGGNVNAKVADDEGHEYQAKYTISVSGAGFANALRAAQAYGNFDYNVATFNCADYALKVFTAAGGQLKVPQFPVPEYSDASNTPQGVYDAIQSLVLAGKPNAMANGQKQWIGNSHGACD